MTAVDAVDAIDGFGARHMLQRVGPSGATTMVPVTANPWCS
ncbi:MAG: hypothetical protein QOH10_2327 [Actinomycetota bacterium]|nr:hypothetical protein [Actinomycetota bacterium]